MSSFYLGTLRGEVSPHIRLSTTHKSHCAKENNQAIESLAPRINVVAEWLYKPIPEGDIGEQERRKGLER